MHLEVGCNLHDGMLQFLLERGAPKDLPNNIGWTALHEACFYNRLETAKVLLLGGASATVRTRLGALPYHLAGLHELRALLEELGEAGAVPSEGDTIDMIEVLTELTNPLGAVGHNHTTNSSYSISFGGEPYALLMQLNKFAQQVLNNETTFKSMATAKAHGPWTQSWWSPNQIWTSTVAALTPSTSLTRKGS